MGSSSELLFRAREVANLGGFMAGVNNNGAHSANAITAMFIATGQDAANVAESSAALVFADTGPTATSTTRSRSRRSSWRPTAAARGCPRSGSASQMLGCYRAGKVRKLAEIVAATVLCGEISLGSAIVSEEWVKAHDLFGDRTRDRGRVPRRPAHRLRQPAGAGGSDRVEEIGRRGCPEHAGQLDAAILDGHDVNVEWV